LDTHAASASAELRAFERATRLFIEGVGQDQLLIRYLLKGGDSSTHEVSFVLDVSSAYKGAPLPFVSNSQANDS
jgi:hypothetical protein